MMIILVALISRAFYSPEVGPEVQNRVGFVCCSFGGPGNGVTNAPSGNRFRRPKCREPTNQPTGSDRAKQKTGLSKKKTPIPYPTSQTKRAKWKDKNVRPVHRPKQPHPRAGPCQRQGAPSCGVAPHFRSCGAPQK